MLRVFPKRGSSSDSSRSLMALDSQRNVHGVPGCGKSPIASLMRERLASQNCTRRGDHPIRLIGAAGKDQVKIFSVATGLDFVRARAVFLVRAVMVIECVLLARLADSPAIDARRNSALNESLVGTHFEEVEAVHEF